MAIASTSEASSRIALPVCTEAGCNPEPLITSKAASRCQRAGRISRWEARTITSAAARSQCGTKPKPKPKKHKHKKHGHR